MDCTGCPLLKYRLETETVGEAFWNANIKLNVQNNIAVTTTSVFKAIFNVIPYFDEPFLDC
jgi:hypothetical protein